MTPTANPRKVILVGGSECDQQRSSCSSVFVAITYKLKTSLNGTDRKLKVYVLCDAKKPRSYGDAIHEAAYLARII